MALTKIPATSVTSDADIFFLCQADRLFPCNLPFLVLSGSDQEINRVRNWPHDHDEDAILSPPYNHISSYKGPLRDIVAIACRSYADQMAHAPFTPTDHLYAHARGGAMNRQVLYTKLYAQYFGA